MDRVVVVTDGKRYRNPYEIWVLLALALSSAIFLFGIQSQEDNAITEVLPRWSTLLWAFMLVTGPLTIIIGMFLRHPTSGRTIQMAGHLWTATGALIYSCALLYYVGAPALLSGLTVGFIAVAAVVRARQLRQQIKQILDKYKEQEDARDLSLFVDGGE